MQIVSYYGFNTSGFNFISHKSFRCLEKHFPHSKVRKVMGFYFLFHSKYQFPLKSVSFISHNDKSNYTFLLARVLNSPLINVRVIYSVRLKFEQYSLDHVHHPHNFVSTRHCVPSNLQTLKL